jgi:hypothetical protein
LSIAFASFTCIVGLPYFEECLAANRHENIGFGASDKIEARVGARIAGAAVVPLRA